MNFDFKQNYSHESQFKNKFMQITFDPLINCSFDFPSFKHSYLFERLIVGVSLIFVYETPSEQQLSSNVWDHLKIKTKYDVRRDRNTANVTVNLQTVPHIKDVHVVS